MESAPPASGAPRDSEAKTKSPTSTSDKVAANTRETLRTLKMSSIGIELALSVVIGLLVGRWLDGKLGTSPWLMIVLLCLGFAAGLRSIVRAMDRASRASDEATAAADQASVTSASATNASATSEPGEPGDKPGTGSAA